LPFHTQPPILTTSRESLYGGDPYLERLSTVKELLLVSLLLRPLLGEVGIIELAHINTRDIDLGRSSNDISGTDSTDGDTIDLEGTSNNENTLGEGLQQNNTLSTEPTSKDDKDGTGLEGWAEFSWPGGFAGLNFVGETHTSELTSNQLLSLLPGVPGIEISCLRIIIPIQVPKPKFLSYILHLLPPEAYPDLALATSLGPSKHTFFAIGVSSVGYHLLALAEAVGIWRCPDPKVTVLVSGADIADSVFHRMVVLLVGLSLNIVGDCVVGV